MAAHDHPHQHDVPHRHGHDAASPRDGVTVGSRLLAMSAVRRMLYATTLLVGLWACVGWAVSYEPPTRALVSQGQRQ